MPLIRYAWSVLMVNVVVIALGALVRATGSGAGCGRSWPTCQGELVPPLEGATAFEFAHRAASGVALVMVGILAIWVFRAIPRGGLARLGAGLAAVAIVIEALIGAMIVLAEWVADDASTARLVAVPLHLVNTLFLLAALTLTIHWLYGRPGLSWKADRRISAVVAAGAMALILIAASGAVTALADTLFPDTGIASDFAGEAHLLTRLRVVHPVLAILAAAAGWWAAGRVEAPRTKTTALLPILVGLMLATGLANVALGVPVAMQLVHLVLADALWIAFVWVSARALSSRVGVVSS